MKKITILLVVVLIFQTIILIIMATEKWEFEKPSQASNYPPSVDFKAAVNQILDESLAEKVFNFWRDNFYYPTFFESLSGYALSGNVPTINELGANLQTAASLNSTSRMAKQPNAGSTRNFLNLKNRLISRIVIVTGNSLTNITGNFTLGLFGANEEYVGFELSGTTLKGSSSNTNTAGSNAITLKTLAVNELYELEIRYLSGNKIVFLVNNSEVGSLTTQLPNIVGGFTLLNDFNIKTTDANAKSVGVIFFDLLLSRN